MANPTEALGPASRSHDLVGKTLATPSQQSVTLADQEVGLSLVSYVVDLRFFFVGGILVAFCRSPAAATSGPMQELQLVDALISVADSLLDGGARCRLSWPNLLLQLILVGALPRRGFKDYATAISSFWVSEMPIWLLSRPGRQGEVANSTPNGTLRYQPFTCVQGA